MAGAGPGSDAVCEIPELDRDERIMLAEFVTAIRSLPVKSRVAQDAYDRAADVLARAAGEVSRDA